MLLRVPVNRGGAKASRVPEHLETPVTNGAQSSARTPKYYSVKLHLLEYIDALDQGAPVPTERELAADSVGHRPT